MQTFKRAAELELKLKKYWEEGKSIGFVPTMGALHKGHLSLVKEARENCQLVVCSIFVNPTQFNNPDDLLKYPRAPKKDAALLEKAGCDFLYYPSVDDVYPNGTEYQLPFDLGHLDEIMEGKYRPGHFKGVAQVVHRLLEIVKPTEIYMGMKDFQQLAVVEKMIRDLELPVGLIGCETIREKDGLAMSSRNARLNEEMRNRAPVIFQTLQLSKKWIETYSPDEVKKMAFEKIRSVGLEPEYFELVDPHSLLPIRKEKDESSIVACVAAFANDVRLIDNMWIRNGH